MGSKEQLVDIYRKCSLDIQKKLHGYNKGIDDVLNDPAVRIKIVSLFKKISQEESVSVNQ